KLLEVGKGGRNGGLEYFAVLVLARHVARGGVQRGLLNLPIRYLAIKIGKLRRLPGAGWMAEYGPHQNHQAQDDQPQHCVSDIGIHEYLDFPRMPLKVKDVENTPKDSSFSWYL